MSSSSASGRLIPTIAGMTTYPAAGGAADTGPVGDVPPVGVGDGVGVPGLPPGTTSQMTVAMTRTTSPATTKTHHGIRRFAGAGGTGTSSSTRGLSTELSSGASSAENTRPWISYTPGGAPAGTAAFTR